LEGEALMAKKNETEKEKALELEDEQDEEQTRDSNPESEFNREQLEELRSKLQKKFH
jgi:hypothetical protein